MLIVANARHLRLKFN